MLIYDLPGVATGAGEEFLKSAVRTAGTNSLNKGSAGRSAGTGPSSPRSTFQEFLSSARFCGERGQSCQWCFLLLLSCCLSRFCLLFLSSVPLSLSLSFFSPTLSLSYSLSLSLSLSPSLFSLLSLLSLLFPFSFLTYFFSLLFSFLHLFIFFDCSSLSELLVFPLLCFRVGFLAFGCLYFLLARTRRN